MAKNTNTPTGKTRKLVVVGDGMCGKTCLLYAFMHKTFDPAHTPTIFDTYATDIHVDDKKVTLALFDTAGEEDFDRLRPLSYSDTNVVLICFCISHPASALNVVEKWAPEIRHFCGQCPIILVACKTDLRSDPLMIKKLKEQGERPVSTETGKQIGAQIKADAYMECSAKTCEGVQEIFLNAARLSFKKGSNSNSPFNCALL